MPMASFDWLSHCKGMSAATNPFKETAPIFSSEVFLSPLIVKEDSGDHAARTAFMSVASVGPDK